MHQKQKKNRKKRSFKERVVEIVMRIPRGRVLTYGQVARRAGNPRATRAVGAIMRGNRDQRMPCHRVIRSDGTLGGYNRLRGISKKELLKREGYEYQR